jgi:hypothetical protein
MVNFNLFFNSAQVCCVGGWMDSYDLGLSIVGHPFAQASMRAPVNNSAQTVGGKDLPMPKVDGRRKDAPILALAKTAATREPTVNRPQHSPAIPCEPAPAITPAGRVVLVGLLGTLPRLDLPAGRPD